MVRDVFLSHSAADKFTADKIRDFLEANGISCWAAPSEILPSEDPNESIFRGIHACQILVVIYSQSANDSESVRSQVECAVKAGKVLVPLRIEDVAPTGMMENYLQRRSWHEAYPPPLEQHLEGLARILQNLTRKRTGETPNEASILRTLPSRSSIVRGAGLHHQPTSHGWAGPLHLSFNFNHAIVSGHPTSVELKAENRGSAPLEHIEIILSSRGLKRNITTPGGELMPGQEQLQSLEIEPLRLGQFALQVTVQWRAGSQYSLASGSRILGVSQIPTFSGSNSTIRLPLINLNRPKAPGETAADPEDLFAPGRFQNLTELLNFELPQNFEELELSLEYEISVQAQELASSRQPMQIPDAFLSQPPAGMLLKLEPLETSSEMPYQEIRLVSRSSFHLGRLREESDFVVWFWPRNEVNDTKTRRISKKHCTLSLKNNKVEVGNTASASLTTFDGQDLTESEGVVLEARGVLNLSGIYSLEVTRFPSNYSPEPSISNLPRWADPLDTVPGPAVRGSVRFLPVTPNVLPQYSVWLLTDGTFGTSRANPLQLKSERLAEIQGRFHHYLGVFWIENLVENAAIEIDGTVLEAGAIVPLGGGQNLKLGDRSYHVTVDV